MITVGKPAAGGGLMLIIIIVVVVVVLLLLISLCFCKMKKKMCFKGAGSSSNDAVTLTDVEMKNGPTSSKPVSGSNLKVNPEKIENM